MAEIKNNFLGAKMNRDIDDRLLSSNEYRYALNLQINRSENSDVGTLQNVLGNSLAVDFNTLTGTTGLQCIGTFVDNSTNSIYIFLTNNNSSTYNKDANNFVYVYNSLNNSSTKLVSGAFLNFSTLNPVIGVNLIEKLLFWTDNRNQPRRINVQEAASSTTYYTLEKQISVAKMNPLYAMELYRLSELTPPKTLLLSATATVGTVTGTGPYTATITPGTIFSSNNLQVGATVSATVGTSNFVKGTVTSIAITAPNITSFVISSLTTFTAGSITNLNNTTVDQYETSMYDVTSQLLPDGTNNPYYNNAFAGDQTYLEDKFIRFSYRYKFEDGEYSIMAPFTQIAYIPKQDGYFIYDGSVSPILDNEADTYRSTIVKFMRNKVNDIFLQIKLPCAANLLASECKISYIEILYKDANELSVNVVDSIPVNPSFGGTFNTSATVYSYNYQSKKPFKTLPERDLIRVYDKTPIKALGQEVAGNRVIYSNYQDKFTYPKYLDYNVGYGIKYPFGFTGANGTSIKEYPNHSVKQNRNYQVGIILCDRFGRESGVILSASTTQQISGITFGGSSLYAPYLTLANNTATQPSYWPGNSLKVLFNEVIGPEQPNVATGWPGIYNEDYTSPLYNPLGWYSYKIVVKQTEQDYYNVYLPGTMASYPSTPFIELGKTSHAVLINDNINKVPRDLTEVGPSQLQFRSSVVLYPRVNNNGNGWKNEMYYPDTSFSVVSTIGNNNTLFFNTTVTLTGYFNNFYQVTSNPVIARISTPSQLGVLPSDTATNVINLSIFETEAIESRLDIYWETSSVGLISELNTEIQLGAGDSVTNIRDFLVLPSFTEAVAPLTAVSSDFRFEDIADSTITPTSVTLVSALTLNGDVVTDSFEIVSVTATTFRLRTKANKYFYYGFNAANLNNYVFNIRATVGSPEVSGSFNVTGALVNVAPSFTSVPTPILNKTTGTISVFQYAGKNGSNINGGNSTSDLTWSVTGSTQFDIDSTGLLTAESPFLEGTFNLTVRMTEASGLYVENNVTVIYPSMNSVTFSSSTQSNVDGIITGTVTIVGETAAFFARSYIGPNSPEQMICTTDIKISNNSNTINVSRTAIRKFNTGTTDSTLTQYLLAGTYNYELEVNITGSGGSVNGSIQYIQSV